MLRMSPTKLVIMNMLTLGLYTLSWAWRHWAAIRNAGHDIWIIPRTIFIPFSSFNLADRIHAMAGFEGPALPKWVPLVLLVANIANNVSNRIPEVEASMVVGVIAVAVISFSLAQFQSWVNGLHEQLNSQVAPANGVNVWVILGGICGALLWGLAILGAIVE